jgi:hypothetical protein
MLAWTVVVFVGRTLARAAGVADQVWKIDELVALLGNGPE